MAIVAALLFFAGARWSLMLSLAGIALLAIGALSATTGYRMARITSWLDPSSDPLGAGWQALHGTYALASGGIWGLGLGASREKWGALPEAHTDFILAVVGEELGLVGTLVMLILFAVVAYAGLRLALGAADPFVRLASAAVTTWFVVQAVVNIGAVLGVLPITGIPLPLVSYGGTSLLSTLIALGMLMAFARREPAAAAVLHDRRARRRSARNPR
jgi:cell division protein FtsW